MRSLNDDMIHVVCFLESTKRGLRFVVFPKNDVKTSKETVYMLPEYCVQEHIRSVMCLSQVVHVILKLYKG